MAQVEPGEFTVAVGGLEATLTLLPASDVEVHAGDTIPGQCARSWFDLRIFFRQRKTCSRALSYFLGISL